ncbi:lipid-binding protein [Pararcticibacter amylolyticus]|nr:lipid-binding protein [Pararcticibacter amylolyticus]
MKARNLIYILFVAVVFTSSGCDTYSDQEVENSAIYPMSGEWLSHVYDASGNAFGATPANKAGSLFALRTYNTTNNDADKAWVKLGTTQAVALLGKVDVNLSEKAFIGQNISNQAKAGTTFNIIEGKVILDAVKLPSGAVADSIYIKYSTTVDGATYIVKGHRRTQWTDTE